MKLGRTGKVTLRGTGGIVTLGGTGGIVTLGDGSGTVRTEGCKGTPMGSAGFAMSLSNILARSTMACC